MKISAKGFHKQSYVWFPRMLTLRNKKLFSLFSVILFCFLMLLKLMMKLKCHIGIRSLIEQEINPSEESVSWTGSFSKRENAVYQLSAYFDNRTIHKKLRVIAATYSQEDLYCFIFSNTFEYKVKAMVKTMSFFKPKYKTIYVTCNIGDSSPPGFVSLVLFSDIEYFPFNNSFKYAIPVTPINTREQNDEDLQLGVVYQPLHNHGLSPQLLDMHIQVMRALEINKFIIYYDRDKLDSVVQQLIDYYIRQNIVIGVNWKLFSDPKHKADTIAVWGQFAQIADSYYRFMKDFDYILNLDADGFPILQNNQTWRQYFLKLSKKDKSELSYLTLSNTYVLTQTFKNKSISEMVDLFSSPENVVMKPCPGKQDKFIGKPSKIIWGYVHVPIEIESGTRGTLIDGSVMRMYHMKTSLVGSFEECKVRDNNGYYSLSTFFRTITFTKTIEYSGSHN